MSKTKQHIPDIVRYIQSHPPAPVNYAMGQKNISYSQINMFHQCPQRWKLIYKDKKRLFSSNISTVFGSSLHLVIQHYLTVFFSENGAAADRLDLEEMFQIAFAREYKEQYEANNKQHFSSADEMNEFYQDAVKLLYDFKKHRSAHFSRKGWYLVGIEVPITLPPHPDYPNLLYLGYLDVVLYHEYTNTIKIYDLKSSGKSWGDWQKKDPAKTNQLILYKKYFSEQYNFPIDNIEIEFFILKRKIYEESEFAQKHIQTFTPASGKNKVRLASESVNAFIEECFNIDNTIKDIEYVKKPSKLCDWCPFKSTCLK